ncbi:MAG: HDIG domain-containing protein [Dehalococcoidia bacterium]
MLRRLPEPVVSRAGAAVFGLVMALATVAFVVPILPLDDSLKQGDRAPRTLVALRDAQYVSDVLTQAARDAAAAAVDPVTLPMDQSVLASQLERVEALFDDVATIRARTDLSLEQKLAQVNQLEGAEALSSQGRSNLVFVTDEQFDALRVAVVDGVRAILEEPVLESEVQQKVDAYLAPRSGTSTPADVSALREMLRAFVVANVQIDEQATEERREAARANEAPRVRSFSEGQVIVNEGELLDAAAIEALKATGVINDAFDYEDLLGGTVFAGGFGLLLGVYVYQLQPFSPPARRRMLLSGITMVLTLLGVRLLLPPLLPDTDRQYWPYAIPVAAAAMVVSSFGALRFAAVVAIGVALFATFIAATAPEVPGASFGSAVDGLQLATVYAASGLAGAVAVHRAERLSRYAVAALAVAFAVWLSLAAFWLLEDTRTSETFGWLSLAAIINGLASAVLGIGVYVLLSMALGVTTRLQLMELAQAGHPLMRRLQDEAPGTYHHSMMVAALAERAADKIGADSLVVRAGSYFHDIGKLAKPGYYIENMLDNQPSPHDSMAPEESAAVIIEHVTNGVEIARRHRLPDIVREFIPQHHGTRLVTYFYRQAVQGGREVDPVKFRYLGPRPQTKEAAIVMLADSCEAVVRARQARTGEEMDILVDSVFAERLAEGQFDQCDITMRELQLIADSFKATLRAVYHPRIEYPPPASDEVLQAASSP